MPGIGGDTLIEDVEKVVSGVIRRSKAIDFKALYGGVVLFSDGDRATVQPDDERLGQTLAQCRVRRPDGMTVLPLADSGVRCLIGWEGGDPEKRYCLVGFDGTGTTTDIKLNASTQIDIVSALVNLGASPAADFVTKQPLVTNLNTVLGAIDTFADAVGTAIPALATPAATLHTAILAFTSASASYSTTKVKAT